MTRFSKPSPPASRKPAPRSLPPGHWLLQDAKARFSELVRRVRSEGPQHVTVHGRDDVVLVSAEDYRRLNGERGGDALIAAMQASPHRGVDIEPKRKPMAVRGVDIQMRRRCAIDGLEKLQKFLMTMPRHALAYDLALQHIERGK